MRFADYLANRLLQAGMNRVFLVTGGGAMHLNDALSRNKRMSVTCFHHEQAAAMAAEGFTRVSGVPCVLNVTTGPGGINALVGVFGAYVDSVPMFVVSGQVKRETCMDCFPQLPLRQLGDQEAPITNMAKSIVKYVHSAMTVTDAVIAVERALYLMRSGRPGPVWLDVPIDVQATLVDESELDRIAVAERLGQLDGRLANDTGCHSNTLLELRQLSTTNGHHIEDQVHEVLQRMRTARRPVILAGTGVQSQAARNAFNRLLNTVEFPVVTGWNALDLIPTAHPNFVGRPGTVGDRAGNLVVQSADLLLVIGCRLNIRQLSYNWKSFAKNAFTVMVDIDAAELDKPTLNINLKINTTTEIFLEQLLQQMENDVPAGYASFLQSAKDVARTYAFRRNTDANTNVLNPYDFLSGLTEILPEGTTVITGNGAACVMTFQVAEIKKNQRYITNSGCASMGYDLPAAIGAALATTNLSPVVCIAGDGSIMMNLQELQTVAMLNLNMKIIILNNGGYLSIRQTQKSYFPDNEFGTDRSNGLTLPCFKKIADAFGLQYQAIRSSADLNSADFKAVMESGNATVVEAYVDVDQGFSPKLASRINSDGSMSSPELDDMAPFLSREALESARSSLIN
jgi:acetolactate synthase I/II/III large subunit